MKIYNTLTGKKEVFKPAHPGEVTMYVCGVTVYDYCHLGHARSAIVFDMIYRTLLSRGYRVKFVRNFTDVDDKIIQRAAQEGMDWKVVAQKYVQEYYHDMDRLGVQRATIEPRATEHIQEMMDIIQGLLEKDVAYAVDGNVYFRIARSADYGKLSGQKLDEIRSGARVEVDERKEDPLDFALWKASKTGEPSWNAPWGAGRPGWHIECSAMSMKYLGETFDIHGGGKDLIFPHHENEIAQSECHTGKMYARYWVHNGFVMIDQEKMSKSLGNFFTIREIFEKSGCPQPVLAEIMRVFLLSTHYRSPLEFSDQALNRAKEALDNFYILFQKLGEQKEKQGAADRKMEERVKSFQADFEGALEDDWNTADAIARLQILRNQANRALSEGLSARLARQVREAFRKYGAILGILQLTEYSFQPLRFGDLRKSSEGQKTSGSALDPQMVERLIQERIQARRLKDWKRADQIRQQLESAGITLEDLPDDTTRVLR